MMDERLFQRRVRELATEATAVPAPRDAWEAIEARLDDGETVILPVSAPRSDAGWGMRRGTRVALFALAVGASGIAAMPGSPVRSWVRSLMAEDVGAVPAAEPTAAPSMEPVVPVVPQTTLTVEPLGGSVNVSLTDPSVGVRIHVRFAESGELEVRARGESTTAQFRSSPGRLTIARATGGDLMITIPHGIDRVRVEVNGRAYLTKEAGLIRVLAPAADTVGSEIVLPITN